MKKLMFALIFAVLGLAVMDASAGYRRCWNKNNCNSCTKSCETKCATKCDSCAPCAKACKIDFVEEQPCEQAPCCVRYVRVEEPALVTKHISYTTECPSTCTPEEKAAGMIEAGTEKAGKY